MPAPIFQELEQAPVSEMVQSLAVGIAQAQLELDMMSTRVAEMMTGTYRDPGNPGQVIDTRVRFDEEKVSLMALGFCPTFYQFVETVVEVKVSVSMRREETSERTTSSSTTTAKTKRHGFLGLGGSTTITHTSSVSARYASRFQYSAEGASVIRTKLVPVPPPAILQERMIEVAQENQGE